MAKARVEQDMRVLGGEGILILNRVLSRGSLKVTSDQRLIRWRSWPPLFHIFFSALDRLTFVPSPTTTTTHTANNLACALTENRSSWVRSSASVPIPAFPLLLCMQYLPLSQEPFHYVLYPIPFHLLKDLAPATISSLFCIIRFCSLLNHYKHVPVTHVLKREIPWPPVFSNNCPIFLLHLTENLPERFF